MIVQFFIPHPTSQTLYGEALSWYRIVAAFALILGLHSLIFVHYNKLKRARPGWGYSVVTLASLPVVALFGIIGGVGEGSTFMRIYRHIMAPLQATMFSLLAFFMASAAFRAFKARTLEASVLLAAAIVVMFGRVPLGYFVYHKLPDIVEWLLTYPNMAGQRGILIGVALGMAATALKIILGIERGWLGGGK